MTQDVDQTDPISMIDVPKLLTLTHRPNGLSASAGFGPYLLIPTADGLRDPGER